MEATVAPERVSIGKGIMGVISVVVIVACYIALSMAMRSTEMWPGFLFGVCFGMIEQFKLERLPRALTGSLVGLLAGAAYSVLPPLLGAGLGTALPMGISILLVFLLVMNWLPIAVNTSTMVYITVLTVPQIAAGAKLPAVLLGFGVGVAYFAALALLTKFLTQRQGASAPSPGSLAGTQ